MEAFVGVFIFLLVLSTFVGVSFLGLSIWGVSRVVKAVARYLRGDKSDSKRMGAPPQPKVMGENSNEDESHQTYEVPPRPYGSHETPPRPQQSRSQQPRQPQSQQYEFETRDYEYLDVEHGATAAHISEVMHAHLDDYMAGEYAQAVIDALATAEFRRKTLFSEIDNKFERNTFSWDRFASTANAALDAILRNCALLANRVQAFDSTDYARMEQFYTTGGFSVNGSPDPARLERWKLLDETKREMDGIRATNENLLLELTKLASELGKLSSAEHHDQSARIADEVSKLVDETKYYR